MEGFLLEYKGFVLIFDWYMLSIVSALREWKGEVEFR